ncbi:MAG: (p)ppGpp synthetase [Desulfobacterales bacterium GWB2_56_26]|nr:MAG: (p)ppGpp synthetase [Desulfobacterales bacterium GWB2_56_26]
MASLDFEHEKNTFRSYYESNRKHFFAAKNAYIRIIGSLIKRLGLDEVTKVEGRVKNQEECIKKFHRKYQNRLEADEQPYEIKDFISDMIGIRIVCLYQDQIALLSEILQQHFKILAVSDKASSMESSEDSFGYKSLHMDLALNDEMVSRPKYQAYANNPFEVQIRSLIQDAWSVLDHKIKYKKSIPSALKRRINILSALFEMADREFMEIRNATTELMQQETVPLISEMPGDLGEPAGQAANGTRTVDAFNFLRIAGHFFRDFEFDDYKADEFVHEILKMESGLQKSDLHKCMTEKLKTVRDYRDHYLKENPDKTFSPYTSIRHCLYLYDTEKFGTILSKRTKERFAGWLNQLRSRYD